MLLFLVHIENYLKRALQFYEFYEPQEINMSYDYYLSPIRPEADAVADLEELASINKKRPYFLLVHVRESSNIKRVKSGESGIEASSNPLN